MADPRLAMLALQSPQMSMGGGLADLAQGAALPQQQQPQAPVQAQPDPMRARRRVIRQRRRARQAQRKEQSVANTLFSKLQYGFGTAPEGMASYNQLPENIRAKMKEHLRGAPVGWGTRVINPLEQRKFRALQTRSQRANFLQQIKRCCFRLRLQATKLSPWMSKPGSFPIAAMPCREPSFCI